MIVSGNIYTRKAKIFFNGPFVWSIGLFPIIHLKHVSPLAVNLADKIVVSNDSHTDLYTGEYDGARG